MHNLEGIKDTFFLKIDFFFFLMVKVTVQHFAFLIYDTKSEMKYPLTEAVVVFQ